MALNTYCSLSNHDFCSSKTSEEPLKLLAIETSASACSLAVQEGGFITAYHEVAPRMQTQLILPKLEQLLAERGLALQELDAVVYGRGPGSFTGIRIAACVAQGIAYGAAIPLLPISSLTGLAQFAYQQTGFTKILTAIDARAGQVYFASFLVNSQGLAEPLQEEGVYAISPNEDDVKMVEFLTYTRLIEKINTNNPLETEKWFAIGNGWRHHEELLNNSLNGHIHGIDSEMVVNASALLPLGYAKIKEKPEFQAIDALPVYLR